MWVFNLNGYKNIQCYGIESLMLGNLELFGIKKEAVLQRSLEEFCHFQAKQEKDYKFTHLM